MCIFFTNNKRSAMHINIVYIFSLSLKWISIECSVFTFTVLDLFRRQSHKSFFEKSDLFFVCMLQPLSFDIQIQASEIEAAKVSIENLTDFQINCHSKDRTFSFQLTAFDVY